MNSCLIQMYEGGDPSRKMGVAILNKSLAPAKDFFGEGILVPLFYGEPLRQDPAPRVYPPAFTTLILALIFSFRIKAGQYPMIS